MNPPSVVAERPPAAAPPRKPSRPGPAIAPGADREARQRAAILLEVLAGARTPPQAAQALGLSLPRYYQLEVAALRGLVEACQSKPRGRAPSAEVQLTALRKQVQRLEQDLARQQGLVRLTQRAVGLPPPTSPPATPKPGKGKGRKPRRPVARALRAAARLRSPQEGADDSPPTTDGQS
jgi:hypothetical protein